LEKVSLPSFPVSGGCQCGAVRYRLKGAPVTFYLCHCTECQKQSSSAFGESVRVRARDVETDGETKSFTRTSENGNGVECRFCLNCGTRLFHLRPGYGEFLNVKGGSLDDTSWLKPAGHIWTRSKQPHVIIPEDAVCYPGQPESDDELEKRWRAMTAVQEP
jgi:hypothetical protein